MKKGMSRFAVAGWLFFLVITFCLVSLSATAYSADKAIAKLTSFSGTVLIKSQGAWGVKPEKGLSLYSDDKIVTKMGNATISFNDGAVIEIKANSNLLIRESEESGVAKQLGAAKRQLRLLIGKMLFRSGKGSSVGTSLETTTMVCGLRGTEGTLSIDAAGQTYLQFTEGGGDTIGNFIAGIAVDVPVELANLNTVQRAAFVAAAAADQAKQAAEKLARGETTESESALEAAKAAKAAAQEAKAAAEAMLNNPDESIRNEALAVIAAADEAIKVANEAIAIFLSGGDDDAVLGNSYGVLGDALTRQVYSPAPQGNENDILPSGDGTPPVIELTNTPDSFDSSSSPVFAFFADEAVTYYYRLDGGSLVRVGMSTGEHITTFELSALPEGSHSLELIVRNASGVETSTSYSWITDYTPPVVALAVAPGTIGATLAASNTNAEPGTVTYSYINADGSVFSTAGLTTGAYNVAVIATDQAGNVSLPQPFSFVLQNSTLSGEITGTGSVITGTAIGDVSAITTLTGQGLGGWTNTLNGTWSGTHTGTISLISGGSAPEAGGNWLSIASGTMNTTTGAASGTTDYIMMNLTTLTEGTGTFSAIFNDTNHTWSGTETGSSLRTRPLRYSGSLVSSGFYNYTNEVADSFAFGNGGAAQNGNLLDGVLLGEYAKNETGPGPYLMVATVMGIDPMEGQIPSALAPAIWKNGLINGFLSATYDDLTTTGGDAGIFYESLTGNYYAGIGTYDGMWLAKAQITPIEMVHDVGINGDTRYMDWPTTQEIQPIFFETQVGGNISFDENAIVGASTILPVKVRNNDDSLYMLFGAWGAALTGSYSAVSDGWTLSLADNASSHMLMEFGPGSTNSTWTSSTQEISAFAAGAWVDLTESVTGVAGGKLIGTFDPTNQVWQAIAAGAIVDTKTFLAMADTDAGRAKLAQLDIPCIQVGAVNLSGTGDGGATTVAMNNVRFFAYSTGASPKIWATGDAPTDVKWSTYSSGGMPSATLSGASTSGPAVNFNSVSFTVNNVGQIGGAWDATVSGSGTVGAHGVTINGHAAGTRDTMYDYSGTASGVARE
jgi:hypothetical protein